MTRCACAKPAPDIYLRAAELLGFAPEQCLAIEDSVTGTVAAEAAGCPVLVVPNDVEVPAQSPASPRGDARRPRRGRPARDSRELLCDGSERIKQ